MSTPQLSIKQLSAILFALGTVVTGIWTGAPVVNDVQELLEMKPKLDEYEDMQDSLRKLFSRVENLELQKATLQDQIQHTHAEMDSVVVLRGWIMDVAAGNEPFDSIWVRDQFGWKRKHVREYFNLQ